jgi:hypothetical protein
LIISDAILSAGTNKKACPSQILGQAQPSKNFAKTRGSTRIQNTNNAVLPHWADNGASRLALKVNLFGGCSKVVPILRSAICAFSR